MFSKVNLVNKMTIRIEGNRARFRSNRNGSKVDFSARIPKKTLNKTDQQRLEYAGQHLDFLLKGMSEPDIGHDVFSAIVYRILMDADANPSNIVTEELTTHAEPEFVTETTMSVLLKEFPKSPLFAMNISDKSKTRNASLAENLLRYFESLDSNGKSRDLPLKNLKTDDLAKYVEWRSSPLARKANDLRKTPVSTDTISKELALLRRAVMWGVEHFSIPMPTANWDTASRSLPDNKKVVNGYTLEEQRHILGILLAENKPLCALTLAYLTTGLRLSEMKEIKLEGNAIKVFPAPEISSGKTKNAHRIVALTPFLVKLFESQYFAYGMKFIDSFTKSAQKCLGKYFGKSDLEFSAHRLRHSFASNHLIANQGEGHLMVSRQLGHGTPEITYGQYSRLFRTLDVEAKSEEYKQWLEVIESGGMGLDGLLDK